MTCQPVWCLGNFLRWIEAKTPMWHYMWEVLWQKRTSQMHGTSAAGPKRCVFRSAALHIFVDDFWKREMFNRYYRSIACFVQVFLTDIADWQWSNWIVWVERLWVGRWFPMSIKLMPHFPSYFVMDIWNPSYLRWFVARKFHETSGHLTFVSLIHLHSTNRTKWNAWQMDAAVQR